MVSPSLGLSWDRIWLNAAARFAIDIAALRSLRSDKAPKVDCMASRRQTSAWGRFRCMISSCATA